MDLQPVSQEWTGWGVRHLLECHGIQHRVDACFDLRISSGQSPGESGPRAVASVWTNGKLYQNGSLAIFGQDALRMCGAVDNTKYCMKIVFVAKCVNVLIWILEKNEI